MCVEKMMALLLAHAADQSAHLMLLIRVQTVGRLVQHQDFRVVNDGLRETGAVAEAFGKGVHALVQDRLQKAHFHHALDGLFLGVAAQAAQFRA